MGNDGKPQTVNSLQTRNCNVYNLWIPIMSPLFNRWATSRYLATPQTVERDTRAKIDAARCTGEFAPRCEDASFWRARMSGRGAYSARSILAGSIRTAWITAGNEASSAAATIASDGSRIRNYQFATRGRSEKSCCTKFCVLHILLHKTLPRPPKTPHFDVVLCIVSC
jgi:hypothetical protein